MRDASFLKKSTRPTEGMTGATSVFSAAGADPSSVTASVLGATVLSNGAE